MVKEFQKDLLKVCVYASEQEMGEASARYAAGLLRELCAVQEEVNILLSTARSQEVMLRTLEQEKDIDWSKVNVFHVDEYIGFAQEDERRLSRQLLDYFFRDIQLGGTYFLDPLANDLEQECARYEALLRRHPTDIAFLGIGDNGHIAFNEPGQADFHEPRLVKIAVIDEVSKRQLVNHKNFGSVEEMPNNAYTLTLTALMAARYVIYTTPFRTKAVASYHTVFGPIDEGCPASIMRRHKNAVAFFDSGSSALFE